MNAGLGFEDLEGGDDFVVEFFFAEAGGVFVVEGMVGYFVSGGEGGLGELGAGDDVVGHEAKGDVDVFAFEEREEFFQLVGRRAVVDQERDVHGRGCLGGHERKADEKECGQESVFHGRGNLAGKRAIKLTAMLQAAMLCESALLGLWSGVGGGKSCLGGLASGGNWEDLLRRA